MSAGLFQRPTRSLRQLGEGAVQPGDARQAAGDADELLQGAGAPPQLVDLRADRVGRGGGAGGAGGGGDEGQVSLGQLAEWGGRPPSPRRGRGSAPTSTPGVGARGAEVAPGSGQAATTASASSRPTRSATVS